MKRSTLFFAAVVLLAQPAVAGDTPSHHEMVMRHGAQVMPFDQTAAMHMFTPNARGGAVEIMVHDMDSRQIALVRSHLKGEAAKFGKGDFSDPAYIHGKNMPGLSAMSSQAKGIQIRYSETPMGARIVFEATSPPLIAAIHQWLAAQQRDHNGGSRMHCEMR